MIWITKPQRVTVAIRLVEPGKPMPETRFMSFATPVKVGDADSLGRALLRIKYLLQLMNIHPHSMDIISVTPLLGDEIVVSGKDFD